MKTPLVSICVPNLNTLPFLAERFESIFAQSLQDWELLVYDSYSEDGAWEYIQSVAARDPRVKAWQGPREGTPGSWNPCIREAKGEYVYVATSDDSMATDCLEKLVQALERHPECDLAHCPLRITDEKGTVIPEANWPSGTAFGPDEFVGRTHVRKAPYDGILHLAGYHVYLSITQLLIRRSLFDRVGGFPSKWKAASDFSWEMKATLLASTVHVPDTWATWRRHSQQATTVSTGSSNPWEQKMEEMIEDALAYCESQLPPAVVSGLRSHWSQWTSDKRRYYKELRRRNSSPFRRRAFQLKELMVGSAAAKSEVASRLVGKPKWDKVAPDQVRQWLESSGVGPVLVPERENAVAGEPISFSG